MSRARARETTTEIRRKKDANANFFEELAPSIQTARFHPKDGLFGKNKNLP
jgi:hypothetical protein